ncbi:MAG: DUF2147 domain-containing protein [Massilia sp.]
MSVLLASLALASPLLAMAADSPVGLWKTIDDKTGQPTAYIRIAEVNGELQGKIEKLVRPSAANQNPLCLACKGARKDQPLIGMTILSGLKSDGDKNTYTGGQILDPGDGSLYKAKLSVIDNGSKLDVRGYIGMPMLGRSQVWLREQ